MSLPSKIHSCTHERISLSFTVWQARSRDRKQRSVVHEPIDVNDSLFPLGSNHHLLSITASAIARAASSLVELIAPSICGTNGIRMGT